MSSSRVESRIAVIGAAVSANKGAASMAFGLLDGLHDAGVEGTVSLLTTYPDADQTALGVAADVMPSGIRVATVDASPAALLMAFLVALPIRLLDRVGIPIGPLGWPSLIRAVRESEVTVDLAGISFADGRGVPLLGYNAVMSLFPYLAGGKVVKASQAIGPTDSLLTRTVARIVLPRMETICARGATTREHLDRLGLTNVVNAADIAFLMHSDWNGELAVAAAAENDSPVVAVLPSSVVDGYATAKGIDHIGVIASVIDDLVEQGTKVIVAPHSFRTNGERGRMNDGPVVGDIENRCSGRADFMNRDLDPRELRAIIASADVVVTGRFHGMVSALEVGTPPVVIGWSHKYGEVLDQFDVGSQGIRIEDLSFESVADLVHATLQNRDVIGSSIASAAPVVHESAQRNIAVIMNAARAGTDAP